jgi:hypothetical protein
MQEAVAWLPLVATESFRVISTSDVSFGGAWRGFVFFLFVLALLLKVSIEKTFAFGSSG